jgi:hypothetical protein
MIRFIDPRRIPAIWSKGSGKKSRVQRRPQIGRKKKLF